MSDKEVKNVIAGALEILADGKNWVKGVEDQVVATDDLMTIREQSCLWGAIKRAVCPGYYRVLHTPHGLYEYEKIAARAASRIGEVIREQYPDRLEGETSLSAIIPFNDHRDTTHSEIVAVLEKALAK